MKRLRVEQRKGESADLFALRAFALAMPHMDINAVRAFAGWIWDRSKADYEAKMRAATVDGLTCLEWVKKRRNETGCLLQEAKAEWDRRVSAQC
jgi:hypothetical protein